MKLSFSWPLIHGVLFYLVWFVVVRAESVAGGDGVALVVQAAFVIVALLISSSNIWREGVFAALLGLLGSVVDRVPISMGLSEFPHAVQRVAGYPLWLTLMWICFATAFSTSLRWLIGRRFLQATFGLFGGVLSILAAERFGAVVFPNGQAQALAFYGVEWCVMMVAAFELNRIVMSWGTPRDR